MRFEPRILCKLPKLLTTRLLLTALILNEQSIFHFNEKKKKVSIVEP